MFIHDWHWFAARIAGGCAGLSYLLYIYAIFFGHLRPQRATWFIWSMVSILLLTGLIASGEKEMIWIPWAYALGSSVIFLISIWKGVGVWSNKHDQVQEGESLETLRIWLDVVCIALAAGSLVVWKLMGTPELPIFINLFADLMGFIPTFKKSWVSPLSERNAGWILFTIGNAFNFGSVTVWNLPGTVYMIYMFTGCLLATILVYRPVKRISA